MTTLPEPDPETLRRAARSFGADAERYDRTRPRYPQAVVDRITAASPGPALLDVGCGTGVAARQFRSAGCRVLGIEPDERMARLARRDGIEVEIATIEDWDPAGRRFDAVVAGQTWHWVDAPAGTAKAARALRAGGRLALFWNVAQPPAEAARAFAEVHNRLLPETLRLPEGRSAMDGYSPMFAAATAAVDGDAAFGEARQWRFDWERRYDRDEWLDQLPTGGIYTRLPEDTLAALLAGTGAAVDALGGAFTMRYTTVVVTAERTGRA